MSTAGTGISRVATRAVRRHLVGRSQRWRFERPAADWRPPAVKSTSLYLHVPFCLNACPYCPYTKVAFRPELVSRYTLAALDEMDLWAEAIGPARVTSIYIGGGTPTLAMDAVDVLISRARERFDVCGDVCIETNPADITDEMVNHLQSAGIALVSVGVQSFSPESLKVIGRRYSPDTAREALRRLTESSFESVNADIMFALPGQSTADVIADLEEAAALGVNQLTTYPLFTFPYTSVGEYLDLKGVRMPDLRTRREQYAAIAKWCASHGFERVSVWGFRRGSVPRYSSVTRDGYIGIGPGSGSHLPDGFVLNTFDLEQWEATVEEGRLPVALRMPFTPEMSGWWWLYWRFYDTRIPLAALDEMLGHDAEKARRWLETIAGTGMARRVNGSYELTDKGAFWLHLAQNHFALSYVNTLWTAARATPWPERVEI
ncbi:MAG TPA: coproporphyrinogen-III oxidase family protein [Coriobacteriia bacterium]|nr:coproporphyrinogen-III oxidase family protein [Coriobacteriia bacterium]